MTGDVTGQGQMEARFQKWALLAVLVFCGMVGYKLFQPGGLTQFGGFGERFEHRFIDEVFEVNAYIKPDSGGYDGQFYAQLATDPTLANPQFDEAIDEPAYRSRRMLLPCLANWLAFGNPHYAIFIYCSFNIFLWLGFAAWIWKWIEVENWQGFARWICCIFSMGVMDSVKYSLTDLPSIFLILILIRYAHQARIGTSGGFVLSLFLKETNLLAMAAIPSLEGRVRDVVKSFLYWGLTATAGLVAFYFWYRIINLRFDTFHGVSGNFDWPLASMGRNLWVAIQEITSGNWDDRYIFRILAVFGFLWQLGFLLTRINDFKLPLVRLGLIYGFLFLFLGDLVWWGYWAVCRVVLPMTIAFNLLYRPRNTKLFWIGLIIANFTIIHSIYRFV